MGPMGGMGYARAYHVERYFGRSRCPPSRRSQPQLFEPSPSGVGAAKVVLRRCNDTRRWRSAGLARSGKDGALRISIRGDRGDSLAAVSGARHCAAEAAVSGLARPVSDALGPARR